MIVIITLSVNEVPSTQDMSHSSDNKLQNDSKNKEREVLNDKDNKHKNSIRLHSSKNPNRLLPIGVLFDPKSGFVTDDEGIPEPTVLLDYEYRIRLHSQLNK